MPQSAHSRRLSTRRRTSDRHVEHDDGVDVVALQEELGLPPLRGNPSMMNP